jgi:hypothetical protein
MQIASVTEKQQLYMDYQGEDFNEKHMYRRFSKMAIISISQEGGKSIGIADVFITSKKEFHSGSEITFEVLEEGAEALKALIGKRQHYVLDTMPFGGELKSLDPCSSTHPGLAYLQPKRTLRGVLSVIEGAKP